MNNKKNRDIRDKFHFMLIIMVFFGVFLSFMGLIHDYNKAYENEINSKNNDLSCDFGGFSIKNPITGKPNYVLSNCYVTKNISQAREDSKNLGGK